jgi:hypothetical protein
MKKMTTVLAAMLLAMSMIAGPAMAYEDGETLFVGKGDVQRALGLNNSELQAGKFSFAFRADDTYNVTCQWTAGQSGNTQIKVRERAVTSEVVTDSKTRKNPQGNITGFNLTFGADTGDGEVPSIGGLCQAEGNNGVITDVELLSTTPGGLTVNGVPL